MVISTICINHKIRIFLVWLHLCNICLQHSWMLLLHVPLIYSFLLLSNILLNKYTIICFSSLLLIDFWTVSSFLLLWTELLWVFFYKFFGIGIAELHVRYMFKMISYNFPYWLNHITFPLECSRVLLVSHLCQYLVFVVCKVTTVNSVWI